MKSEICVIRHGITEGNKRRLYYGGVDIPLLDEGKEQLAKLRDEKIYPSYEHAEYYTSGIKPYPTKPPKTEGQKLAERILVRTMAGSRYCRYDTYIANCELQGIEAIDTTKAWKSCHCELKKKGYGVNQSNWLVVLDGYELPKFD